MEPESATPRAASRSLLPYFTLALAPLFWSGNVVLERALRGAVAAVGATRAGLFMNLMPVFGAVLAVVLLRESLAAHHLAGAALVLGGITLGSIRGRGPR